MHQVCTNVCAASRARAGLSQVHVRTRTRTVARVNITSGANFEMQNIDKFAILCMHYKIADCQRCAWDANGGHKINNSETSIV